MHAWVCGCADVRVRAALCAHPNPDHLPSPLNSTQATSSGRTSISSVPCASAFSLPSNAWCSARLASRARSVSCNYARVREALRLPLYIKCILQPALYSASAQGEDSTNVANLLGRKANTPAGQGGQAYHSSPLGRGSPPAA